MISDCEVPGIKNATAVNNVESSSVNHETAVTYNCNRGFTDTDLKFTCNDGKFPELDTDADYCQR